MRKQPVISRIKKDGCSTEVKHLMNNLYLGFSHGFIDHLLIIELNTNRLLSYTIETYQRNLGSFHVKN